MTSPPVRIGVIGCAEIARRRLLPAMMTHPDVEITAVASREIDKARSFARRFRCGAVRGYRALLELDEVDAVYVPLPVALHAPWVKASLDAGKHVLSEKPLATSLSTTTDLVERARRLGLALMENVMFVHHSQHETVRRMVRQGVIGVPQDFQASFAIPALSADDIRYDPDLGGGALRELGIYPVRSALHMLGGRLDVVGAVLRAGDGRDVETSGAALLRSEDGISAQLTFGLDHAYRCRYQIWGSEGRITLDRAFTPPPDHEPVLVLEGRTGGSEEIRLKADNQVANTLSAFVAAVRSGETTEERACLRQAHLLDEIHSTARVEEEVRDR